MPPVSLQFVIVVFPDHSHNFCNFRDDRVVLFNTKEGEKNKIDVEKTRLIDEMYKNIVCTL